MPMHFLGGLWIGLVFIWLFWNRKFDLKLIFSILFMVFLIGFLWEIFEIILNYYTTQIPFNALDTLSDLYFDLAGGTFAVLYFQKRIMVSGENEV